MKLHSNQPYWLLKNGLMSTYPTLDSDVTTEVLIIGGGITGALLAYEMTKAGYQTVLVDARDVATGSTSASTAMIQYEIDEPLFSLIDKVGENVAVDSYREGILAIDKLERIVIDTQADCGFQRMRSLYVAYSNRELKWLMKEFTARKKYNFPVEWVTADELKSQFEVCGKGAILSDAGASLDPYRLTHALIKFSIEKYGLAVYDHTEVEKVTYEAQTNTVYTTTKFTITCKHIIYATGYESRVMLNKKIVSLISTYALVSEPLHTMPTALTNTIFWNTQEPYLYTRGTTDNRIIVGGGDEKFKNATLRDKLLAKKEVFLLKNFQEMFPTVSIIADFVWAGTFGVTKDALPYMGSHPDFPNSYFLLGFGGNGITFSVMGTRVIRDAIEGKENKLLRYYTFER